MPEKIRFYTKRSNENTSSFLPNPNTKDTVADIIVIYSRVLFFFFIILFIIE